jgi:hypothetical protein
MANGSASAIEIDRKLREDFRRRVKDFGISAEATDPILAVLFRTFAQEIERLYQETGRIRLALLDEFIAGLHIEPRRARPAQSIVRFFPDPGTTAILPGGAELNANASSGEVLTFITDATVGVSSARVALAFTYQNEMLQLLSGNDLSEQLQAARPSLDPVAARLGPQPAIYIAIENLPPAHLSHHSFFFELGPDSWRLQQALRSEPWCLVDGQGQLRAAGILRPVGGNGGIRRLQWLVPAGAAEQDDSALEEIPELPDGFFADRVFVFPAVPEERQFLCAFPEMMGDALGKIFGRETQRAFSAPRAWLRIPLPLDVPPLHSALGGITMHAMTVSNVECFNQTIQFQDQGVSIPISRDGGTRKHLVAPLAIFGESNTPYLPEMEPSKDRNAGRYAVRQGRLELRPATSPEGKLEAYANVRVWVTDGALGNSVGPGQIAGSLKASAGQNLRVVNVVAAAGGTEGENYSSAQGRFAEALLSRDRIVTEADLVTALRAFDRRIIDAEVRSAVARTGQGLQRVQRVTAFLDRDAFADAQTEVALLERELVEHLKKRFVHGIGLELQFEWNQ